LATLWEPQDPVSRFFLDTFQKIVGAGGLFMAPVFPVSVVGDGLTRDVSTLEAAAIWVALPLAGLLFFLWGTAIWISGPGQWSGKSWLLQGVGRWYFPRPVTLAILAAASISYGLIVHLYLTDPPGWFIQWMGDPRV